MLRLIRKANPFIFFIFISTSLIFSQSLVKLAEKEKERRAEIKMKGKQSIVVTNDDLKLTKILPQESIKALTSPMQRSIQPRQKTTRNYKYASKILPSTRLVENPQAALNRPDGQFAEISMLGILDIEISAENTTSADIAVYARQKGIQEMKAVDEKGEVLIEAVNYGWIEGYWYGVLAMKENGDWISIGQGTGKSSPEKFDISSLPSIKKIRIIFKPHNNPDLPVKFNRTTEKEVTFGIDAVEILQ